MKGIASNVRDGFLTVNDGGENEVQFDLLLWATGASPHPFIQESSSDTLSVSDGYILVSKTLQSISCQDIFASGDCNQFVDFPSRFPPKAGVYAVREGAILIQNIVKRIEEITDQNKENTPLLSEYEPQTDFLALILCGNQVALGFKFGIAFRGCWVWFLKDHIDRAWMKMFDPMLLDTAPNFEMRPEVDESEDIGELTPSLAKEFLLYREGSHSFVHQMDILRKMANEESFREQVIQLILS